MDSPWITQATSELAQNSSSGRTVITESIYVPGFLIYIVLFGATVWLLYFTLSRNVEKKKSTPVLFQYALVIFGFFRILWMTAMTGSAQSGASDSHWSNSDFLFNRIALSTFLSAFSIVLFTWVRVLSTQFSLVATQTIRTLKYLLGALNAVMLCVFFAAVIDFFSSNGQRHGGAFYDGYVIGLAVLNLIGSLAFFLFGLMLYRRVKENDQSGRLSSAAVKIVVITSAVTVCFGLRCAMLLYRPITNKYLQLDLFYWLAYFIPETIPICLQLAAYASRTIRKRRQILTQHEDARGPADDASYRGTGSRSNSRSEYRPPVFAGAGAGSGRQSSTSISRQPAISPSKDIPSSRLHDSQSADSEGFGYASPGQQDPSKYVRLGTHRAGDS